MFSCDDDPTSPTFDFFLDYEPFSSKCGILTGADIRKIGGISPNAELYKRKIDSLSGIEAVSTDDPVDLIENPFQKFYSLRLPFGVFR